MNNWYIGSYYTKNTVYEAVYKNYLYDSCAKLNLENKLLIKAIDNKSTWQKNTAEKPKVILDILQTLEPNDCLLFCDADATIEKYPQLMDIIDCNIDIGYHLLDWSTWYGYKDSKVKELLSGTLFLRNTSAIQLLCQEWYNIAQRESKWEQKVLQDLIEKSNLNIFVLPLEYAYIKSRPNNQKSLIECKPVILHHQFSRNVRKGKII